MFRDKGFRKSAPIEEGEEIEVTIEAVGEKGDGIAKSKGFVIFVPGVKEGDHVKVRVTKVLRNFSFGEVVGPAESSAKTEKKKKKGEEEEGEAEEQSSEESEEMKEDEDVQDETADSKEEDTQEEDE